MLANLLTLTAAHLLADFVLQTDWMVANKRRPIVLIMHIAIVTAASALLSGTTDWLVLAIIFATHLAIDATKLALSAQPALDGPRARLWLFLADQVLHMGVIAALAIWRPDLWNGGWLAPLLADHAMLYLKTITIGAALIAAIMPSGVAIGLAMEPLRIETSDTETGLTHGGRYIGWLERAVSLLLILIGEPGGIGFVIGAKSILRFGDINENHERKRAEYIIIGTFLSFGAALAIGAAMIKALAMFDG